MSEWVIILMLISFIAGLILGFLLAKPNFVNR